MSRPEITPQVGRENPDPAEAANPPPGLYLVFFGVMATIGFVYLVQQRGDDLALAGDQRSPRVAAAAAARSGEAVFQATCASCHQPSGAGVSGVFPPLVASPWLLEDAETPIRIVLLGLEGEIEVAGQTYRGVMPALGGQLGDAEIAAVLTHVRASWGNAGAAIKEEDVARVRAATAGKTGPWRGGAELQAARAAAP
jgi:mono/diheme cytochrome c family protein